MGSEFAAAFCLGFSIRLSCNQRLNGSRALLRPSQGNVLVSLL